MRNARRSLRLAAALAVLGGCAAAAHRPPAGLRGEAVRIRAADLRTRVEAFSHDSLQGRFVGTAGGASATAYIAAELAALGIQPAGDAGSYFQDLPFVSRTVTDASTLSVGGAALAMWADWAVLTPRYAPPGVLSAPVLYWGADARDTTELPSREQAAGKIVLFSLRPAAPGQRRNLPFSYYPPGSRMDGALAVAYVVPDSAIPASRGDLSAPVRVLRGSADTERPPPVTLWVTRSAAERMMGTSLDSAGRGALGPTATVELRLEERLLSARNVVAVIPGRDPALRTEYLALGAHGDGLPVRSPAADHDSLRAFNTALQALGAAHPGDPAITRDQRRAIRVAVDSMRALRPPRPDSVRNGADDNASGSMVLLELAEFFAAEGNRPRRSVLLVWHTGEELGLLGARHFTENPTISRDAIVGHINLDMVGRGGSDDVRGGGPDYLQLVGSRRLSSEFGDLLDGVNREGGHGFRFDYSWDAPGHPENLYCRSDHAMYARFGIPVVFVTTGLHRDYHQVTDEAQYLDYAKLQRVAALVAGAVRRIGDLPHRPRVDQPVPDPRAPCR